MLEVLNNKCASRNSTAFGIKEIPEDEENVPASEEEEPEVEAAAEVKKQPRKRFKDIVREFVMQEERASLKQRRSKLPLKLKKELKPASVTRTRAKLASASGNSERGRKLRARSLSTDNLHGSHGGVGWNMSSSIDRLEYNPHIYISNSLYVIHKY